MSPFPRKREYRTAPSFLDSGSRSPGSPGRNDDRIMSTSYATLDDPRKNGWRINQRRFWSGRDPDHCGPGAARS